MRKYKLTRSKRKTLAIKINKDSSLEVKAPINLSNEKIDEFVKSKEKWISKHSKDILEKYNLKKQFTLKFGDCVFLRGECNPILATEGNTASYNPEEKKFYIPEIANSKQIKELVVALYKLIAKSYINDRVSFFANKMNIYPQGLRITSAKTRWGSCSGKNTINFTWKLIMADDEVIDYVVVHELAHIKEHNHSKNFWKIVESIIPDYKVQQAKLKKLSENLAKEDWDI
jgi:predicted metal-dependent hydrolase